jgi:hypothetical protein
VRAVHADQAARWRVRVPQRLSRQFIACERPLLCVDRPVQPAQGIRQKDAGVVRAVATIAEHESEVIGVQRF